MVCEIWSTTFFTLLPPPPPNNVEHRHFEKKKKIPKDIIISHMWSMTDRVFSCILDHFLPFYPPKNPENQNFEKMKKTLADIILHMCTKNHDHMLYCSSDTAHDRCNCYFSFWANFLLFIPITAQKKINEKKSWRYHHFTHVYQNYDQMTYKS